MIVPYYQDEEICLRGCVICLNMVSVGKEVAEKVFSTQIFDVFQALVMKANLDAGSSVPSPTLIKIKEICERGLEVAHQHNIVRTQQEAAQASNVEEEFPSLPGKRATFLTESDHWLSLPPCPDLAIS